jgi:hypothetical protein
VSLFEGTHQLKILDLINKATIDIQTKKKLSKVISMKRVSKEQVLYATTSLNNMYEVCLRNTKTSQVTKMSYLSSSTSSQRPYVEKGGHVILFSRKNIIICDRDTGVVERTIQGLFNTRIDLSVW